MKKQLMILALALSSAVWAGDYEDGQAAYHKKNYTLAVSKFKKAAAQGNAKAQLELGTLYATGKGVEKNKAESVKWYTKAAEQGDAEVQFMLAVSYLQGNEEVGIEKNTSEGSRLLNKVLDNNAFEKMTPIMQLGIAQFYLKGNEEFGIEKNTSEGLRLLDKVLENNALGQDAPSVQFGIAQFYLKGNEEFGIEKNTSKGLRLLMKIADKGNAEKADEAQFKVQIIITLLLPVALAEAIKENETETVSVLTEFAEQSNEVAQDFLDQVTQKNKYLEAANQGDADAQYNLGWLYKNGLWFLGSNEPIEALRWFKKAAEQGHAKAQHELGKMYYEGTDVEKDEATAVRWLTQSAKQVKEAQELLDQINNKNQYLAKANQGDAEAQYQLGEIYKKGMGVEANEAEAVRLWTKAAEQDHVEALSSLGQAYLDRINSHLSDPDPVAKQKEYAEAARWFIKAAEKGNAEAQFHMGVMYTKGQGLEKNPAAALHWLKKSAEQGNAEAQYALNEIATESKKKARR